MKNFFKKFMVGFVFIVFMTVYSTAFSQQVVDEKPITDHAIIMMNSTTCSYCISFLEEGMPEWKNFQEFYKNKAGVVIPNLYILDMPPARSFPEWVISAMNDKRIPHVQGTPTFFYWDGIKVLDQVIGYGGNNTFRAIFNMSEKHGEKNGKE